MIRPSYLTLLGLVAAALLLTCSTQSSDPVVELASGFKYLHSRESRNSDTVEMDCTGDSPLITSAFLFIFGLTGFRTECKLKIRPEITVDGKMKSTAILKIEVPAFIIFSAFADYQDKNLNQDTLCSKGIKHIFGVTTVDISGDEVAVEPERSLSLQTMVETHTGSYDNCLGIYHVDTAFTREINIHRRGLVDGSEGVNWSQLEALVRTEDFMVTVMEYYEMMRCGPKSSPLTLEADNSRSIVQNPRAALIGAFPRGTECFYQVEPSEEHCDTVLSFRNPPENCNMWQMTAFFNGKNETFDCGGKDIGKTHDNPPWIIHHPRPLIRFKFGEPGAVSSNKIGTREEEYAISASCLHTEDSSHAPRCSSECSLTSGAAKNYKNPCWGRSNQDCVSCRFARDEGQCVSQCSMDKFRNELGLCQQCSDQCLGDQSCFSSSLISCYKLCGEPDKPFVMNKIKKTGQYYAGYEALDTLYFCTESCQYGTVAFLNLTGTNLEHDDHYNQELAVAIENGILDKINLRCITTCPEGYEIGKCGSGAFSDTQFCCPAVNKKNYLKILLIVILVPAVCSALLVLLIVFCIWGCKKHRKTVMKKEQALKDFYIGEGKSNIRGIANKGQLIIVEPGEIELKQVIGQGAFGCVYSAIWCPHGEQHLEIPVAVKQLKNDVKLQNQNMELLEEAKLMASVNHDNLVRLIAISMNEPMMLITKFMTHGASLHFIQTHKDIMSSYQFMEWARQLAAGMAHLESKGMIHRDLAARNVLVEHPKQIRISDFGLSKLLDADKDEVDYRADDSKLPIRWLAKECLTGRLFSHKSDVWAYGVTLWEFFVYGYEKPYGKVDLKTVKDLVIRGRRLMQPATCSLELYTLLLKCWMSVPDNRPSFTYLEQWFAESRECAGKYFFTSMRNAPLGDAKKIQSNMVNLSTNSNNSNEFSNKTTLEADVKPRERVAPPRGGGGSVRGRGAEHQEDTSIPRRGGGAGDGGGSDSDQEYLVPQKPPGGGGHSGPVSPGPTVSPNATFRNVDEDEYLRPVPMPRTVNQSASNGPPMHDTTSSVEADPRGGIQDFSIETRENQLKKFFPDMDVSKFDKAANIIDGNYDSAGAMGPDSNYRDINDVEAGSTDPNLDRKDKIRISQRWKGNKKPPLQQQQRMPTNPDASDYANQAAPAPGANPNSNNPYARVQTADSMRRTLPAESSV